MRENCLLCARKTEQKQHWLKAFAREREQVQLDQETGAILQSALLHCDSPPGPLTPIYKELRTTSDWDSMSHSPRASGFDEAPEYLLVSARGHGSAGLLGVFASTTDTYMHTPMHIQVCSVAGTWGAPFQCKPWENPGVGGGTGPQKPFPSPYEQGISPLHSPPVHVSLVLTLSSDQIGSWPRKSLW